MREDELAWWQRELLIYGFDGEGDGGANSGGDGGAGAGGASDDDGGDDGNGADDDDGDGDDGDDQLPEDLSGLKSAIQKERAAAKASAKEARETAKALRDAKKQLDDIAAKDLSESEKATKAATAAADKVVKLSTRLRTQAVDALIERNAREMKFIDVDDALTGVDRTKIEVEQDDDDPSDIRVDAKTVKAAVKALADKKQHLIQSEEDDGKGGPSGSRFGGGSGKKGSKEAETARLKELYPSLR